MARGKRSGRNGSLGQDKIEADLGVPETAETVEYEELPDGPPAAAVAQPEAGPGTDIGRIDAMAQPEETREPDAPAPVSELPPPKARGFVPGLIGGLIGGAVVALGGGWYAYEHGPIKPALSQLEATTATAQGASSGVTALGGKVEELDKTVDGEIAALKQAITSVPILGNGDIWSADDAIRMVEETGCDGVVVGRGCLGRPWLFGDLAAAFRAEAGEISRADAEQAIAKPPLGFVMQAMRRHAELLIEFFDGDEDRACRDIRKHVAWYYKGYGVGGDTRRALAAVESLAQMDEIFGTMDASLPYPGEGAEGQRGRAGSPKRVVLPDGWLSSRSSSGVDYSELVEAERQGLGVDGG